MTPQELQNRVRHLEEAASELDRLITDALNNDREAAIPQAIRDNTTPGRFTLTDDFIRAEDLLNSIFMCIEENEQKIN